MNAAPTFPRSAPTIIAIASDPAWAGYLLAACQAVTGDAAETPQLAAYRIIAERKARQIKPSAAPRLKPATLRCLNVGIVDQF